MKARVGKIALAIALASGATVATADPLEQLWFDQTAGFADDGPDATGLVDFDTSGGALIFNGFSNPSDLAGTFREFSWQGNSATTQISSILLEDFSTDTPGLRFEEDFTTADADGAWNAGDWWQISQLTQTNNILRINSGSFPDPLWVADSLAELSIFDNSDLTTAPVFTDPTVDRISFTETLNTDGPCPVGTNPLNTTCDDIFGVALSSFAPVFFNIGDDTYRLNFRLRPGPSIPGPVTTTTCSLENIGTSPCDSLSQDLQDRINGDANDGVPELLVFTPENSPGTSQIQVFMSFESVVPAPATLALLGLGMLALGRRALQSA